MAKKVVGSMSDWSGTLKDLFRQFHDGSLTLGQTIAFKEHRNPFEDVPRPAIVVPATPKIVTALPDIDFLVAYQKYGMEAEYRAAMELLPAWSDQNLWIVPVIAGKDRKKVVTCNMVVAAEREAGIKVWTYYNDLDANITVNDRDPARDGSYLIGFRRTVEADEENKNLSADMLATRKHNGSTCLERKILGHGYFLATGQHLDVETVTLCTASRYQDGGVPGVGFTLYRGRGRVHVHVDYTDGHSAVLRSRTAVPPPVA